MNLFCLQLNWQYLTKDERYKSSTLKVSMNTCFVLSAAEFFVFISLRNRLNLFCEQMSKNGNFPSLFSQGSSSKILQGKYHLDFNGNTFLSRRDIKTNCENK